MSAHRGSRPSHARPPLEGVSWDASPDSEQMRHRAVYARTVQDVAKHDAHVTRNVMQAQADSGRVDASVLIFEDGSNSNETRWTSLPVGKDGDRSASASPDPQFAALGFEKPKSASGSRVVRGYRRPRL